MLLDCSRLPEAETLPLVPGSRLCNEKCPRGIPVPAPSYEVPDPKSQFLLLFSPVLQIRAAYGSFCNEKGPEVDPALILVREDWKGVCVRCRADRKSSVCGNPDQAGKSPSEGSVAVPIFLLFPPLLFPELFSLNSRE